METQILLSLCIGVGLSAACGLRIFVPFLVMNFAARGGHLTLATEYQWLSSDIALIAFSTAAILEISAYYVPWLDNLLDSIMTPAAVAAGSILTASQLTELSPFLQWSLAIIAGGGTAGVVQSGTVLVRGTSTAGTAGAANFIVSTSELMGSTSLAVLAMLLPIVVVILIGIVCFYIVKIANQRFLKRLTHRPGETAFARN